MCSKETTAKIKNAYLWFVDVCWWFSHERSISHTPHVWLPKHIPTFYHVRAMWCLLGQILSFVLSSHESIIVYLNVWSLSNILSWLIPIEALTILTLVLQQKSLWEGVKFDSKKSTKSCHPKTSKVERELQFFGIFGDPPAFWCFLAGDLCVLPETVCWDHSHQMPHLGHQEFLTETVCQLFHHVSSMAIFHGLQVPLRQVELLWGWKWVESEA